MPDDPLEYLRIAGRIAFYLLFVGPGLASICEGRRRLGERKALASRLNLQVKRHFFGMTVAEGTLDGIPITIRWYHQFSATRTNYRVLGLPGSLVLHDPQPRSTKRAWMDAYGTLLGAFTSASSSSSTSSSSSSSPSSNARAKMSSVSTSAHVVTHLTGSASTDSTVTPPGTEMDDERWDERLVIEGDPLDRALLFHPEIRSEARSLLSLGFRISEGALTGTIATFRKTEGTEAIIRRLIDFVSLVTRTRAELQPVLIRAVEVGYRPAAALEILVEHMPSTPEIRNLCARLRSSPSPRERALAVIGSGDDDALRSMVTNSSLTPRMRAGALRSLLRATRVAKRTFDETLESSLLDLLASNDEDAQHYAALALQRSGTRVAVEPLKDRLRTASSSRTTEAIRVAIERIKARLGEESAGHLSVVFDEAGSGNLALASAPDGEVSVVAGDSRSEGS